MSSSPSATPTPITPPRVPLIDERTGLIDRAWYMFFLSLFTIAQSADDVKKAPDANSALATYDALLRGLRQEVEILPTAQNLKPEIDVLTDNVAAAPNGQVGELQQQISDLRQEIETIPVINIGDINEAQKKLDELQNELRSLPSTPLGTLAQLQQDNVPWLQFDTTPAGYPTGALAHGTLYWDDADRSKTLALVMEDTGNVIQDIGEETFYRVRATAPITQGQVLMFTGTVGASGGLKAAPATGLTPVQSEYILGIATQDIATNGWGYATWFGEVNKVDTTGGAEAWVDGEVLYYNPAVAGGLTKFVPTAPNPKVIVASVVHAATNGILFVRPTFGSALGATDSNVEITGLTNGDLLQYDGTQQRWENVPVSSLLANVFGPPVTKTADFTIAAGETWIINNKSGSTCTVTLPTAAASSGRFVFFQNYQAQALVSASNNVVPRAGGAATTTILDAVAGDTATLVCDGTNWIIMQYGRNNVLLLE